MVHCCSYDGGQYFDDVPVLCSEFGADSDNDSYDADDDEEREKLKRRKFITDEFKRRNQGSTAAAEREWEPPTADCPLRCPSSRRIAKLTVMTREHCLTLLQSALVENLEHCWTGIMDAATAHQCAVSMEYEIFSGSKLPVSYKAAVMKCVNGIKKLTGNHELHADLVSYTTDSNVDDVVECIADSHTLVSSIKNPSSFCKASAGIVAADGDAVNAVYRTCCDKDDISVSSLACKFKSSDKCDDDCDVLKSDNEREFRGNIESRSVSETTASVGNRDFVDDYQKVELSQRCDSQSNVIFSRDIDHSDAGNNSTGAAAKKSKSVRISDSPATVSYIDCQHHEVSNGEANGIIKELAMKQKKLLNDKSKVDKLCASQQSTEGRDSTNSQSWRSCTKSEASGKLEMLAVDDRFCQVYPSHSSNSLKQLTAEIESTRDQKLCKKDAADIVIRLLTPYYKSQRFGSKDVFKEVARLMTHRITDSSVSRDNWLLCTKDVVKGVFSKLQVVSCIEDVLPFLAV